MFLRRRGNHNNFYKPREDNFLMNLIELLMELDGLKRTYRFSTMNPEVRDSSADHSWKLAFMVSSVAKEYNLDINIEHAMELAVVHDIPEYITGEIDSARIVNGEVSRESKAAAEKEAVKYLGRVGGKAGSMIYNLFLEFEEGETRVAKYVNALDKIEALTHLAVVAEKHNDDWNYTITYADKAVSEFPELKPLLRDVKVKLREVSEKSGFEWKSEYDKNP